MKFKKGDRVSKKDGKLFSNKLRVNTVKQTGSQFNEDAVWFEETNTWIHVKHIVNDKLEMIEEIMK